jgi:hypothetical protein
LEALLIIVPFPPAHPVAGGVKVTLRDAVCPGATTNGKRELDRLKALPVRLTAETVTLVCPPLLKTTI